jgi:hypothetical protein
MPEIELNPFDFIELLKKAEPFIVNYFAGEFLKFLLAFSNTAQVTFLVAEVVIIWLFFINYVALLQIIIWKNDAGHSGWHNVIKKLISNISFGIILLGIQLGLSIFTDAWEDNDFGMFEDGGGIFIILIALFGYIQIFQSLV